MTRRGERLGRMPAGLGWFCCLLFLCAVPVRGQIPPPPTVEMPTVFAALDLNLPALDAVRKAVSEERWDAATAHLAAYYRHRKTPVYFSGASPARPGAGPADAALLTRADRAAEDTITVLGVSHPFANGIDWRANPTRDKYREWTWQLNRHGWWRDLAAAYRQTGKAAYVHAFARQMNGWLRQCPPPGGEKQVSENPAWRPLEAGIRMSGPWMAAFFAFRDSPAFSSADLVRMLDAFFRHGRYLARHHTSGNRLTHEMKGLFFLGVLFPEFSEAARWRDMAAQTLTGQLSRQVYPDGVQFELSTTYHKIAYENFLDVCRLARLNGVALPAVYSRRLEHMLDYMLYAAMPNGVLPALNDAGPIPIAGTMERALAVFPARADFRWAATWGRLGTRPQGKGRVFPYAGQVVMRTGWHHQDAYVLFDAGPFGYGHQHEDKLSFVFYAHGKPLVIDPGNFDYDDSRWRRYFTGPAAHNTVLVDGTGQKRAGAPRKAYVVHKPVSLDCKFTPSLDYARADFGRETIERWGERRLALAVHTRHLFFQKATTPLPGKRTGGGYLVVFDQYRPADDAHHCYEALFHLDAATVDVFSSPLRVETRDAGSANIAILPVATGAVAARVVRGREVPDLLGWIPRGKGRKTPVPSPVAVMATAGSGAQWAAHVLYPLPPGENLPVTGVELVCDMPDTPTVLVRFRDGRVDAFTPGHYKLSQKKDRAH